MQINLFVQTVQIWIWAIGSTSKGHRRLGNFTINRPLLDWVITLLQIPPPTPLCPLPLNVDPMAQIEVCTERLVCTWYVLYLYVQTMQISIWAIGSIFKGHGRLCNFTINRTLLDWVITLLQIPPLTPCTSPLGYWSDGPDWSLHSLHGEVGLHMICSPVDIIRQQCTFKNLKYPDPRSKTQNSCLRCKACITNQCSGQIYTSYNTMYIQNEILTLIIWWSYLLPKFASMTKMLFQSHPKSV